MLPETDILVPVGPHCFALRNNTSALLTYWAEMRLCFRGFRTSIGGMKQPLKLIPIRSIWKCAVGIGAPRGTRAAAASGFCREMQGSASEPVYT